MERIDCESCNGSGEIELWGAYKICSDCDGLGWVWNDEAEDSEA